MGNVETPPEMRLALRDGVACDRSGTLRSHPESEPRERSEPTKRLARERVRDQEISAGDGD